MEILARVIWILGWPVAICVTEYLDYKVNPRPYEKKDVSFHLLIWIIGAIII